MYIGKTSCTVDPRAYMYSTSRALNSRNAISFHNALIMALAGRDPLAQLTRSSFSLSLSPRGHNNITAAVALSLAPAITSSHPQPARR